MLRMRKGHIVTIASMASFVAAPGLLDYCCSKVGALYISEGEHYFKIPSTLQSRSDEIPDVLRFDISLSSCLCRDTSVYLHRDLSLKDLSLNYGNEESLAYLMLTLFAWLCDARA